MAASKEAYGLSPLVPVPWAGIRKWLDSAEEMQTMTGGSTAHLPHTQILALSRLADFIQDPPVPKTDAVSQLMRMSADAAASTITPMNGVLVANGIDEPDATQGKQHLGVPVFEVGEPVDVPYRGAFQLRWHCVCVLPWCDQRFPKMDDGKAPILFSNKKDAKQYAAMEALAFLNGSQESELSHAPPQQTPQQTSQPPAQQAPQQVAPTQQPLPVSNQPNTSTTARVVVPVAPTTPPSANNRPKRPLESPSARPVSPFKQRADAPYLEPVLVPVPVPAPVPAPVVTSSPAVAAVPPPLASPNDSKGAAAAEQARLFSGITRLCARLGISQPQYKLAQDPARPSFFSGRAEFSVASRVPQDIAVVKDVLGKRQARIQIAEQVLSWMEDEEARRQALVDGVLSGM